MNKGVKRPPEGPKRSLPGLISMVQLLIQKKWGAGYSPTPRTSDCHQFSLLVTAVASTVIRYGPTRILRAAHDLIREAAF
jgi:hypothetical protein